MMKPCQKEAAAESGFCSRKLRAQGGGRILFWRRKLMGEKWRLFLWALRAPVVRPQALLLGSSAHWILLFRVWPPTGPLCPSGDLASLRLPPPTQAAASAGGLPAPRLPGTRSSQPHQSHRLGLALLLFPLPSSWMCVLGRLCHAAERGQSSMKSRPHHLWCHLGHLPSLSLLPLNNSCSC